MVTTVFFTRNHKFWFLSFTSIMIGLAASTALALDPMGPPVAGLVEGQLQVGIDYSRSNMDLELDNGTWVELLDGVLFDAGEALPFELKNFKAHRAYANIGYGATDRIEAFVRIGGTEARFGDSVWMDQEKFESSTDFAVGGGLKVTFFDNGPLQIGGLLQANWSEYNGTLFAPHWAAADRVEIDLTEVQVAFGAAYSWADRIAIYGGPFFHFVSGDFDDTYSVVDPGGSGGLLTSNYQWEIDEDSVFGAYIGAQVELNDNCSFNVEYQRTAAADAIGLSLMVRN